MASIIALSILYAKHPNKHNNQQFKVKKIKNPVHVKLEVT